MDSDAREVSSGYRHLQRSYYPLPNFRPSFCPQPFHETYTSKISENNFIVIEVHSSDDADESSLMYKIKYFITTGNIQVQGNSVEIFANEDFPVLKRLISQLEQQMNQDSFM